MKSWYVVRWDSHPKEGYVSSIAEGGPLPRMMWDNESGYNDGSYGICDLMWWPGWVLANGWPTKSLTFWPK